MTDNELLKLAAKAAKYRVYGSGKTLRMWKNANVEWVDWNPLENDGDALRLAVKLRMDVSLANYYCCAVVDGHDNDDYNYAAMVRFSNEFDDKDCDTAEEATRIAIVRTAAAIGRKME